jgi:outer membrane protein
MSLRNGLLSGLIFSAMVVVFFCRVVGAQAAAGMTLEEAITRALAHSPDIASARSELAAARETVAGARDQWQPTSDLKARGTVQSRIPTMEFAVPIGVDPQTGALISQTERIEIGRRDTWNLGVTAQMPVFTGGRLAASVQVAESRMRQSESGLDVTEGSIKSTVAHFFLDCLLGRELATITEENLESARIHTEVAKARVDAQITSRLDLLRAEVLVIDFEEELLENRAMVRQGRIGLARLMGIQPDDVGEPLGRLESPTVSVSQEDLQRTALAHRPDRARLVSELDQAKAEVNLLRTRIWPRVDLQGGIDVGTGKMPDPNQFEFDATGSLIFSLPLLDARQTKHDLRAAESRVEICRQRLDSFDQAVEEQIRLILDDIAVLELKMKIERTREDQTGESVSVAEAEYAAGLCDSLEVVNARIELAKTLVRRTRLKYNIQLDRFRLEEVIGRHHYSLSAE